VPLIPRVPVKAKYGFSVVYMVDANATNASLFTVLESAVIAAGGKRVAVPVTTYPAFAVHALALAADNVLFGHV